MANRIKVQVLGNNYYVSTERTEGKMREIESHLNEQLAAIAEARPNLSVVDSLVVLALNLMDQLSTGEESMDRMREQLAQYLEDASRVRAQLDEAQAEVGRLNRELSLRA